MGSEGEGVVADGWQGGRLDCFDHSFCHELGVSLIGGCDQLGETAGRLLANIFVKEILCKLVDNIREVELAGEKPEDPNLGNFEVGLLGPSDEKLPKISPEHVRLQRPRQVLDVP